MLGELAGPDPRKQSGHSGVGALGNETRDEPGDETGPAGPGCPGGGRGCLRTGPRTGLQSGLRTGLRSAGAGTRTRAVTCWSRGASGGRRAPTTSLGTLPAGYGRWGSPGRAGAGRRPRRPPPARSRRPPPGGCEGRGRAPVSGPALDRPRPTRPPPPITTRTRRTEVSRAGEMGRILDLACGNGRWQVEVLNPERDVGRDVGRDPARRCSAAPGAAVLGGLMVVVVGPGWAAEVELAQRRRSRPARPPPTTTEGRRQGRRIFRRSPSALWPGRTGRLGPGRGGGIR